MLHRRQCSRLTIRYPGKDPRYPAEQAGSAAHRVAQGTVARFLPHWHEVIAPTIKSGQRVVIAAHGNSLRALVKHLDGISDEPSSS